MSQFKKLKWINTANLSQTEDNIIDMVGELKMKRYPHLSKPIISPNFVSFNVTRGISEPKDKFLVTYLLGDKVLGTFHTQKQAQKFSQKILEKIIIKNFINIID